MQFKRSRFLSLPSTIYHGASGIWFWQTCLLWRGCNLPNGCGFLDPSRTVSTVSLDHGCASKTEAVVLRPLLKTNISKQYS